MTQIITIQVDVPCEQVIGLKEQIAERLEKIGDVRIVKIEERGGKKSQLEIWDAYCQERKKEAQRRP